MKFLQISYKFTSRLGIYALILVFLTLSTLAYAVEWHASPKPMLGIVYWYPLDETFTIVAELEEMKCDGFQIVCVPYVWNDNPQDSLRVKTDVFFHAASQLGLKVYVRQPDSATLEQYLNTYGSQISYFQTINEADIVLLKEWLVPGEISAISEKNTQIIKKFNPNIKTVASFASPLSPDLIASIAEHVDIVALDIYEQAQLDTFPIQMQVMLSLAHKNTLWIGEFGCASLDDETQAAFISRGLEMFKNNGVETVIVWCWKHNTSLEIKGRQAEQTIKNFAITP